MKKTENTSISRPQKKELRQALEIKRPRTAKEHLRKLLAEVGCEDSLYGETYFLPFQIESLKLTKVGPFDNFEAYFCRNSINLIHGTCGSGKSTIVRAILFAFGIRHRYFTNRVFNNGTITLRLFPKQDSISITGNLQNLTRGYQCLIADDPFERLIKNMVPSLFRELKRLKIQAIMTVSPLIDITKLPEDIHIISI
ncbi:MAG: AAA family ATPase [Candidatus Bathyarchaeia archaeon]